ncbi:hypothetical protein [Streptomyces sp. NBC_00286]|nr:hypothetical protein [Streptomyces sp. NBC_00286]
MSGATYTGAGCEQFLQNALDQAGV